MSYRGKKMKQNPTEVQFQISNFKFANNFICLHHAIDIKSVSRFVYMLVCYFGGVTLLIIYAIIDKYFSQNVYSI
jgi:hypothetical protein